MVKRNTKKWFRHGAWWKRLFLDRRYKDVLFRRLFREKRDLLDLYNALNGSTYTNPEALEVVTLEDVIFMKMKNDLSFIIGSHLQSHGCLYRKGNFARRSEQAESGGVTYAVDRI